MQKDSVHGNKQTSIAQQAEYQIGPIFSTNRISRLDVFCIAALYDRTADEISLDEIERIVIRGQVETRDVYNVWFDCSCLVIPYFQIDAKDFVNGSIRRRNKRQ